MKGGSQKPPNSFREDFLKNQNQDMSQSNAGGHLDYGKAKDQTANTTFKSVNTTQRTGDRKESSATDIFSFMAELH